MATPTATFETFLQVGLREDLTDMIYRISPTETPFFNSCAREVAKHVKHEWQIDRISNAVATNQAVEGNNPTNTSVVPTSRIFNFTEIPQYAFQVSGTSQAMNPAGRASELAFQLVKYGLQMKRDMEAASSQNNGIASTGAGGTTVARVSASLESWMSSNHTSMASNNGTTGFVTGTGTTAPIDCTSTATVTEANVKAIIRAAWNAGGNPDTILVGPYNKVKVSGFSGILTNNIFQQAGGQAKIVAAADAYVSDFGTLKVIPSRFNRDRTISVLDMNYWAIAYLRPFQSVQLAVTGDSIQRMILAEYTLVSRNEAASGKVVDCATS
jgi:hypothetical protein